MKAPGFRTQLVLAAGLIQLYSLGVGASWYMQSRAHGRLERSFHEGLTVLSALPRLRDQLRRVDQAGDQYLTTGQAAWLDRREEALEQTRGALAELRDASEDPRARGIVEEADRRLAAYLAERGPWISRRVAGRLTVAEAARAARRQGGLDAIAEPLNALRDVNLEHLRARRDEVERASTTTLWLILLAGAAAAAFVAALLARTLTRPVARLRENARKWTLGSPWDFPPPPGAGPEVADLHAAMGDMARRLNAQFEKESELGRLKGDLVNMASHEFNNALSVLGGTANLLLQTEPGKPTGRRAEYYQIIESNLRQLALAVRNLLDLGLLESGRYAVRPRRAELGRVLNDAAAALKPLYERKGLQFSVEFPPDLPPALADPEALLLVAVNLVGNAVKYTPEGGRVMAAASREPDGRLKVSVADTGVGIKPEDRERVLSGHRTEEGRRTAQGFGVGLQLVKTVLDAHGAKLAIEGGPGKGTLFSFTLPAWTESTEFDVFL